jgi:hypothetical protein
VDACQAASLLKERLWEGEELLTTSFDGLNEWKIRTATTMRAALAPVNPLVANFNAIRYSPGVWTEGTDFRPYRRGGIQKALGVLRTAIYELEELADSTEDASGYDDELWQHVAEVVVGGRWDTVASQAVIFLEDRLRKWSGRPATEYGTTLVANVLKDAGDFPLGQTDGEKRGWMNFGVGIVGAVGNAVRHRIDDRTDPKRYALGVLGAVSLLVTELKNSYPDRCKAEEDEPEL